MAKLCIITLMYEVACFYMLPGAFFVIVGEKKKHYNMNIAALIFSLI